MTRQTRKRRSFTLVEMLVVVSLMGIFAMIEGPLMLHLIFALGQRTKSYDQLFLVSQISDRVRSDLQGKAGGPAGRVLGVEADRLRIDRPGQTVEYRADDKQIERIELQAGQAKTTAVWKVPYAALSFARQPGRSGMALVELHWALKHPGPRRTQVRKLELEMDLAAVDGAPQTVIKGDR